MKLRTLFLTASLAVAAVAATAPAAQAQVNHYDRYYGARYYEGRDRSERRSRRILQDRVIDLGDRVRLAEREGAISRYRARDLYEELDGVRDFLVHDRYLSQPEFERRTDDLNHVEYRLREYNGSRHYRYSDREASRYR